MCDKIFAMKVLLVLLGSSLFAQTVSLQFMKTLDATFDSDVARFVQATEKKEKKKLSAKDKEDMLDELGSAWFTKFNEKLNPNDKPAFSAMVKSRGKTGDEFYRKYVLMLEPHTTMIRKAFYKAYEVPFTK